MKDRKNPGRLPFNLVFVDSRIDCRLLRLSVVKYTLDAKMRFRVFVGVQVVSMWASRNDCDEVSQ